MSDETFSVIVWCWHDVETDTTQLRVMRTDTAEEVHVRDGIFLLRILTDEQNQVERCLIRHLASQREAYIQGSLTLRAFVKACLVNSEPSTPDGPGE